MTPANKLMVIAVGSLLLTAIPLALQTEADSSETLRAEDLHEPNVRTYILVPKGESKVHPWQSSRVSTDSRVNPWQSSQQPRTPSKVHPWQSSRIDSSIDVSQVITLSNKSPALNLIESNRVFAVKHVPADEARALPYMSSTVLKVEDNDSKVAFVPEPPKTPGRQQITQATASKERAYPWMSSRVLKMEEITGNEATAISAAPSRLVFVEASDATKVTPASRAAKSQSILLLAPK